MQKGVNSAPCKEHGVIIIHLFVMDSDIHQEQAKVLGFELSDGNG